MTKPKENAATLETPTTHPGHALNEVATAVGNRLSVLLLLCLSPLVGLLFVVCLPFVGFGALIWMAGRALTGRGVARTERPDNPEA